MASCLSARDWRAAEASLQVPAFACATPKVAAAAATATSLSARNLLRNLRALANLAASASRRAERHDAFARFGVKSCDGRVAATLIDP